MEGRKNAIATPIQTSAMEADMQNVVILLSLNMLNISASSLDAIFILSALTMDSDLNLSEK